MNLNLSGKNINLKNKLLLYVNEDVYEDVFNSNKYIQ